MNNVRELLRETSDIKKRQEITEHFNSRPEDFWSLLDEIFDSSEDGYSEAKRRILDLVDFLIPRLAVQIIERAIFDADDRNI